MFHTEGNDDHNKRSDIPFWWKFDVVLGSLNQRALGRVMLKAMLDFSNCSSSNCKVGGLDGTIEWPVYSSAKGNRGVRTRLDIPISSIHAEPDDEFDKRCQYIDKIIESQGRNIIGQSPPLFRNETIPSLIGGPNIQNPISKIISMLYSLNRLNEDS